MTSKQEKILQIALQLFAQQGYDRTSTNQISKQAKVSEALIFRHFTNKEGLLQAVLLHGKEGVNHLFAPILKESNPEVVIEKTIAFPLTIPTHQMAYWKLMYMQTWKSPETSQSVYTPLKNKILVAFAQLGYTQPIEEAEALMLVLDGITTGVVLHQISSKKEVLAVLQAKYVSK